MNDELRVYLMAIMAMLAHENGMLADEKWWFVISVAWAFLAIVFAFINVIEKRKKKKANTQNAVQKTN